MAQTWRMQRLRASTVAMLEEIQRIFLESAQMGRKGALELTERVGGQPGLPISLDRVISKLCKDYFDHRARSAAPKRPKDESIHQPPTALPLVEKKETRK